MLRSLDFILSEKGIRGRLRTQMCCDPFTLLTLCKIRSGVARVEAGNQLRGCRSVTLCSQATRIMADKYTAQLCLPSPALHYAPLWLNLEKGERLLQDMAHKGKRALLYTHLLGG